MKNVDMFLNSIKNVTKDLVNKSERDINNLYPEWTVKEFEPNRVVLQKSAEGECGEHYILRASDGKIVINLLDENGKKKEYQKRIFLLNT